MQIDPATIARIATATGTPHADVAAFLPVFIDTAKRAILAGHVTLEELVGDDGATFAMIARVAAQRIATTLEENTDAILASVWERVRAGMDDDVRVVDATRANEQRNSAATRALDDVPAPRPVSDYATCATPFVLRNEDDDRGD